MEIDSLLTDQRWNILSQLSKTPSSPLQLAGELRTSMANISQQLRLLEAAQLVAKEKLPNRERGKPRSVYRIANNFGYLVSITHGFAGKRLLILDRYHEIILRTWFIKDENLHLPIERALGSIFSGIDSIKGIFFNEEENSLIFFCESEDSKRLVSSGTESVKKARVHVLLTKEGKKMLELEKKPLARKSLFPIYDPENILSEKTAMRGDSAESH